MLIVTVGFSLWHMAAELVPELLGAFLLWLLHVWRTKVIRMLAVLLRRAR